MPKYGGIRGRFMKYMDITNETGKESARRALEDNRTYGIEGWYDALYFSHYSEEGNLLNQTLDGIRLNYVHFQQADFSGPTLLRSKFVNVLFNQSSFVDCEFTNVKFLNCDLSHTLWTRAVFRDVEMRNCRFVGLDVKKLKAAGVKVVGGKFDGPTDDDEE
jgi:uncharacterized protein YjbI with pentapeptide repeats